MKDVIYKVLWATIEDFVGLWEIHWELNSLLPEKDQEKNKEILRKILSYFLETGLVLFYLSEWGGDELKELSINDALIVINNEKYWEAPFLGETCIKIGSTPKGLKFYNEKLLINIPRLL